MAQPQPPPPREPDGQVGLLATNTPRSRPLDTPPAGGPQPNSRPLIRTSRPLHPIERPLRASSVPVAQSASAIRRKPRWGRRLAIMAICVVIVLATLMLIIEGIMLTTGKLPV